MTKKLKMRTIARYHGHSVKTNKSVDLTLKFEYGELTKYIQLIQFLNENIKIGVKQSNRKPCKLGIFMISQIKVDHDGEGIVKFNSMLDYVESDEVTKLVGSEVFQVMFEAEAEDVEVGCEDEDN